MAGPTLIADPATLALLSVAAFATAVLSAVVGMAGGITLLAVMLLYFEPLVAIPLHGVVQLVSNGSRSWVQRRHVEWPILARYSILLLPMGFLGLKFAQGLSAQSLKTLIGTFVLLATWLPGMLRLKGSAESDRRGRRFFWLGGVVGFVNVTIGATGPLIAPFFLNLGLSRQALVGTKAACQAAGHLAKLAVFGVAGFAFAAWLPVLALLSACVIAGTWCGSQLLERVSESTFVWLYKTVLTAIALRLVWTSLS